MNQTQITTELLHEIPQDLQQILASNQDLLSKWNQLTSLAKNEWICWVTIVKTDKTRKEHIESFVEEIMAGEKRPCCWPGCPH